MDLEGCRSRVGGYGVDRENTNPLCTDSGMFVKRLQDLEMPPCRALMEGKDIGRFFHKNLSDPGIKRTADCKGDGVAVMGG